MTALVDLTGRVFGRLSVIERDGSISKRAAWKCLCTCGAIKTVSSAGLQSGKTRSCGCLVSETARGIGLRNDWSKGKTVTRIKPGDVFGRLTVVARAETPEGNGRAAFWACICGCGRNKTTRADSLLQGWAQSCGCLRRGPRTKTTVSEHPMQSRTKPTIEINLNMHESPPTFTSHPGITVDPATLVQIRSLLSRDTYVKVKHARQACELLDGLLAAKTQAVQLALKVLPRRDPCDPGNWRDGDACESAPRMSNGLPSLNVANAGRNLQIDDEPRAAAGETTAKQTNHLRFSGLRDVPSHSEVLAAIDTIARYQAGQRIELAQRDELLAKLYSGFAE